MCTSNGDKGRSYLLQIDMSLERKDLHYMFMQHHSQQYSNFPDPGRFSIGKKLCDSQHFSRPSTRHTVQSLTLFRKDIIRFHTLFLSIPLFFSYILFEIFIFHSIPFSAPSEGIFSRIRTRCAGHIFIFFSETIAAQHENFCSTNHLSNTGICN